MLMNIGELSTLSHVSIRTLRHYDKIGLLRPSHVTEAGYRQYDEEALKKLHAHKTGAMIEVSAVLGCLAAGLSLNDPRTEAAKRFARGIGLAFQIVDDVLDVTADAALLGKPIGSDAENEKTTFLTYFTPAEALDYARAVTTDAKEALAGYPNTDFLLGLADYLVNRDH